jgi:hypothetical protein
VSNPLQPTRLSNVVDHTPLSTAAGTATLGKLADGRFLLVIGRTDAEDLDFYVSTGTDLRTTAYEWIPSLSSVVDRVAPTISCPAGVVVNATIADRRGGDLPGSQRIG